MKAIKNFFVSIVEAIIEARKMEADMLVKRYRG
jgi:hypothetical protein